MPARAHLLPSRPRLFLFSSLSLSLPPSLSLSGAHTHTRARKPLSVYNPLPWRPCFNFKQRVGNSRIAAALKSLNRKISPSFPPLSFPIRRSFSASPSPLFSLLILDISPSLSLPCLPSLSPPLPRCRCTEQILKIHSSGVEERGKEREFSQGNDGLRD